MKVTYDGINFYSYKGEYLRSSHGTTRGRFTLHAYKYKNEVGEVPEGYVVHHKDWDKFNNDIDNLELMTKKEHSILHASNPSDETRRKIREGNRNRIVSEASKEKRRAWNLSDKNTCAKQVRCIETGVVYHSAMKAQRDTGFWNISMVCRGERNDAGGYNWEYI